MKYAVLGLILSVAAWAQTPPAETPSAAPAQEQKADHKHEAEHKHDASHKHADGAKCEHHKPSTSKLGFDSTVAKHHITLLADGGTFQIAAVKADDKATIAKVRAHLEHVAKRFALGDFSAHTYIHEKQPVGVDVMKAKNTAVKYRYKSLPNGGEIVVSTKDAEALAAIHNFLKDEIANHETGDPVVVGAAK